MKCTLKINHVQGTDADRGPQGMCQYMNAARIAAFSRAQEVTVEKLRIKEAEAEHLKAN
jgi:hypothetical protein